MKNLLSYLLTILVISNTALGQVKEGIAEKEVVYNNWHLLDNSSGFPGISLNKAYALAKAKNLISTQLIVAVIDTGIDTLHEDLKPILWRNPKEIPGNGKDDDNNGYVDDVYGWNFIGGKDGRNVKQDSYEGARVYHGLKAKWDGKDVNPDKLSAADRKEYETFLKAKGKTVGEVNQDEVSYLQQLYPRLLQGDSVVRKELGKEEYNGNDLKIYTTSSPDARMVKNFIMNISKANNSYEISNQQLIDEIGGDIRKAEAASTAPPTYRKDIVKDDEKNINDRFYGNNDVMANTPFHGTHCAGIIAAARNNGIGMDGIADNVRIMMVRALPPGGDEHDKDIALAIRYAVDNGAKVISMSFGKDFSPEKNWVDDAFRYAEQKGVLLVYAAGNDAKNLDTIDNFPNPVYADGKGRASNIITVGASGNYQNGGLTASFSNYGKHEVDVFAPGVDIYSTIPGGNTYGNASGTSMACPVVAGVAALILQYYPGLSPQQVKLAIEKSAQAPKEKVNKPGSGGPLDKDQEKVALNELSKTGGIVNAYEALKYAGTLKPAMQKKELPKSKIRKTKMG